MSKQSKQLYEFGPFSIDSAERVLLKEGRPVPLTPKAFDLLVALVENSGHLMEKDELMQRLWPDTFVEEANLSNNISLLRKALGDDASGHHYIETVPKRGYRFVARVYGFQEEPSDLIVEQHTRARLVVEEETDSEGHGALLNDAARAAEPSKATSSRLTVSRARLRVASWLIGALIAVAAGFLLYELTATTKPPAQAAKHFQDVKLAKLTGTGKVTNAAISPDGKYVAYAMNEPDGQSLWLRQVSTSSNIRIVPPAEGIYWGLTFSPDGEYIYCVVFEGNRGDPTLYQVPVLGGVAKRLPNSPDSAISFSPDGKRFAYVYAASSSGRSLLRIANADGSGDHSIAERTQPEYFLPYPSGPAWSPDGKAIACAVRSGEKDYGARLVSIDAEDGAEVTLSTRPWSSIRRLAWLADGSGVVMTAQAQSAAFFQVWLVTFPSGEARAITNDFSEYSSIGLTAGSDQLAAVQTNALFGLWVAPPGEVYSPRQIASESGELPDFCWTADNRIVYRSIASGRPSAWVMNADGREKRQLTTDALGEKGMSVSNDGRFIVFASNRAGRFNLWRIDADGANLKQLTDGMGEAFPQCSPDGRWVVYQSGVGNVHSTLWRVSIEGGEAGQLTKTYSTYPAVSPDGKLIAYFYMDSERPDSPWRIGVVSFADGAFITSLDIPPTVISRFVRWTPDGKALAYIANEGEVSNIWAQPLDGSPAKKLTDFKTETVIAFAWSPDGKRLLVSRGAKTSDVVILSESK
ncbi:MAG TPA: winged helix-turn-helix domain-containing protein [Blastocatellia bacterium]|nr:winged helix-turn-helix domain-containing protein [Blastocatellia bacterium]